MSELDQFIDILLSQVDRGIYVWGGNGEDLTSMNDPIAWIERREEDPANEKRDIALFNKRKEAGVNPIQAFDCSGLVYWALHTLGLQKTDLSSRGFYSLCKHIEEKDLRVGDLVFHHDGKQIVHVGVCVGEEQIECKGRDVGVVRNKRRSGYWNRFGRLPCFDKPEPKPDTHEYIRCRGRSVYVRAGNGKYDADGNVIPIIGTAHNAKWYKEHKINKGADELPCFGQADVNPFWYAVEFNGVRGYITSKSRYVEVIYKV